MPGELQYINMTDFTGGLNLYANQFQLADNESPDLLNVNLDTRAGFQARGGLQRVNGADIEDPQTWDPRSARTVLLNSGLNASYIASSGKVYAATSGVTWADMGLTCSAAPHLADYASWGQYTYFALGPASQSARQDGVFVAGVNDPEVLPNAEGGNFNDDYTNPDAELPCLPQAEVVEPHAGYMFYGNTEELGQFYPNRLRWSHPLIPTSYAENDYIDIETGGGEITALMSFQDHLLIFKTDSLWALYGYTSESFQLIKVSRDIGVPHPGSVTRSESAVYFYSASDRGDIWAYNGQSPVAISEKLRPVMDGITDEDSVWISWVARSLVVSVAWNDDPLDFTGRSLFIWDPDVGQGAWTRNAPATDEIACILDRGDHIAEGQAVFVMSGGTAAICKSGGVAALDYIREGDVTGLPYDVRYRTGWKDAGYPERPKSWRRGRFILPVPTRPLQIEVKTFQDYEEASAKRTHYLLVGSDGTVEWSNDGVPPGFIWGDGTRYETSDGSGSQIRREQPVGPGLSGMGVCAAVQLLFTTPKETNPDGARWGLDAAVLKHRSRRATT